MPASSQRICFECRCTVGHIESARQGGFIIRDAGAEYGDSQKIEKDVQSVTTITFI